MLIFFVIQLFSLLGACKKRPDQSETLGTEKLSKIKLDAHLHYFFEHDGFNGQRDNTCTISDGSKVFCRDVYLYYQEWLSLSEVNTAFLLSPSFEKNSFQANKSLIENGNERTSFLVQKYCGRFIGFCGFNHGWKDSSLGSVVDSLERCLNLPGMDGIKIHDFLAPGFGFGEFDKRIYKDNFEFTDRVLEKIQHHKPSYFGT